MALFNRKEPDEPQLKDLAGEITEQWQAAVSYKRGQGYYDLWPLRDRYINGDQWPKPTEATATMPRPMTNQYASIINMIVSAVTYETPEIYFDPGDTDQQPKEPGQPVEPTEQDAQAAQMLSDAAKHQSEKLELEDLIEQGCKTAANVSGTAIWCFPWDNTITGGRPGKTAFVGDIAGFEVDPINFHPGDPSNPDIQSQPWIIMDERLPLKDVQDFYRPFVGNLVDTLEPTRQTSDTTIYDQQRIEQDRTPMVDVVHRWWKERKPHTDDKDEQGVTLDVTLKYAVVCQSKIIRPEQVLYKHGFYPFVAFEWEKKRKSFWGKPLSADLLPNQRERNRLEGLTILAAQNHGAPRVMAKQGALKGSWTNNPLKIMIDRFVGSSWGIKYMEPPRMPDTAGMIEMLDAGMKDTAGAQDAFSGKAPSSDLNAAAIVALQEAAGIKIRPIQRRLRKAMRDIGRLWLAHWTEFYTEARLIRITGEDGKAAFRWFRGTDYADMAFDVRVKAGTASPFSRSLYIATLDSLYEKQLIDREEYLELLPEDAFPQKDRLMSMRQQKEEALLEEAAQQAAIPTGAPPQNGLPPGLESLPPEAGSIAGLMGMLPGGGVGV